MNIGTNETFQKGTEVDRGSGREIRRTSEQLACHGTTISSMVPSLGAYKNLLGDTTQGDPPTYTGPPILLH